MEKKQILIVSKHAPAIEWLKRQGISGDVISHVESPDQIRGRKVIGNLPLYLAAEVESVTLIMLPGRRESERHREMTCEEMIAAGAYLQEFRVEKL